MGSGSSRPGPAGKTTTLTALAEELTAEGNHVALRFSCESGEVGSDDDIDMAERLVLSAIRGAAIARAFPTEWMSPDPSPDATPGSRIFAVLQAWAMACPLLLVRRYGGGQLQREAFELKVWRDGRPDPLPAALPQFDAYLARCQLTAGTLVIFDRRATPAPAAERAGVETVTSPAGRTIALLRR